MLLSKDFNFGNEKEFILPEDLALRAGHALLDEIFHGGCIDSTNQPLLVLMMALASNENVSQLKIGRLTH